MWIYLGILCEKLIMIGLDLKSKVYEIVIKINIMRDWY